MNKQEVIDQILYKMSHLHMIHVNNTSVHVNNIGDHVNNTSIHNISFYQYCDDRSYSSVKFAQYVNSSKGWLEYECKRWSLSKKEYLTLYKALSDNHSRIIFR